MSSASRWAASTSEALFVRSGATGSTYYVNRELHEMSELQLVGIEIIPEALARPGKLFKILAHFNINARGIFFAGCALGYGPKGWGILPPLAVGGRHGISISDHDLRQEMIAAALTAYVASGGELPEGAPPAAKQPGKEQNRLA